METEKRSSNRRNFENTALRFSVSGKHSENEAFENNDYHGNDLISLPECLFFVNL